MKNIVLCGFMGCGKSTVGSVLSEKTGMPLIDTDTYIEQEAGMTVSQIFENEGERGFRARESAACEALSRRGGCILALGGGAVLNPQNVAVLKAGGTIVLLNVSPAAVKTRLKDDTTRPLLQRPDRDAAIDALFAARLPVYQAAADVAVDAEQSPDAVADAILNALA